MDIAQDRARNLMHWLKTKVIVLIAFGSDEIKQEAYQ